jgi:hypothetical protein
MRDMCRAGSDVHLLDQLQSTDGQANGHHALFQSSHCPHDDDDDNEDDDDDLDDLFRKLNKHQTQQ